MALPKTSAKPVTPTTQVDDMNNPQGFSNEKLVAKATAKARPVYSRVTHKAIGSKGGVNKAPPRKTHGPAKKKLPFSHPKVKGPFKNPSQTKVYGY